MSGDSLRNSVSFDQIDNHIFLSHSRGRDYFFRKYNWKRIFFIIAKLIKRSQTEEQEEQILVLLVLLMLILADSIDPIVIQEVLWYFEQENLTCSVE
ncbi:MAG: hypothetical protein D3915_07095 [Candidatus Electrothrix sp. AU1_5]|nr:hypothetical protein [Candidatus Electrothrix gigas]